jgi:hypothetical protein
VTTTNDSGDGSLRAALATANAAPVATPTTICVPAQAAAYNVANDPLPVTGNVIIRGEHTRGVTIDGHGTAVGGRTVFNIASGGRLRLERVTVTKGFGAGLDGGGATVRGRLEAIETHWFDNVGNFAGGIRLVDANASLLVERSLFEDNRINSGVASPSGSAIESQGGRVVLLNSTFIGNDGAAVRVSNAAGPQSLEVRSCTLRSPAGATSAIDLASAAASLVNSVILPASPDLVAAASVNRCFTQGDPGLGPLGNHGGETDTFVPLVNSPLIDAAVNDTLSSDQRGLPRAVDLGPVNADSPVDIGAVERQAGEP